MILDDILTGSMTLSREGSPRRSCGHLCTSKGVESDIRGKKEPTFCRMKRFPTPSRICCTSHSRSAGCTCRCVFFFRLFQVRKNMLVQGTRSNERERTHTCTHSHRGPLNRGRSKSTARTEAFTALSTPTGWFQWVVTYSTCTWPSVPSGSCFARTFMRLGHTRPVRLVPFPPPSFALQLRSLTARSCCAKVRPPPSSTSPSSCCSST